MSLISVIRATLLFLLLFSADLLLNTYLSSIPLFIGRIFPSHLTLKMIFYYITCTKRARLFPYPKEKEPFNTIEIFHHSSWNYPIYTFESIMVSTFFLCSQLGVWFARALHSDCFSYHPWSTLSTEAYISLPIYLSHVGL